MSSDELPLPENWLRSGRHKQRRLECFFPPTHSYLRRLKTATEACLFPPTLSLNVDVVTSFGSAEVAYVCKQAIQQQQRSSKQVMQQQQCGGKGDLSRSFIVRGVLFIVDLRQIVVVILIVREAARPSALT